jgi:hypothetical protein
MLPEANNFKKGNSIEIRKMEMEYGNCCTHYLSFRKKLFGFLHEVLSYLINI